MSEYDANRQRWCIYIDILGFSTLWESDEREALLPLREMMRSIHGIGTRVFPEPGDRLFVHQLGDGFLIVSDFGEVTLERPLSIAIALLRSVAAAGRFASAAIAEGDFGDIQGCYPSEVVDASKEGTVELGHGLMTLSSVMGTAFIRAYRLHNNAPSGPFLVIPQDTTSRVPAGFAVRKPPGKCGTGLMTVDWIGAESTLLSMIQTNAALANPGPDELKCQLRDYCLRYPHLGIKWGPMLQELLSIRASTALP